MRSAIKIVWAGAIVGPLFAASLLVANTALAAPVMQVLPDSFGVRAEKAGCGWISGWNGPAWVCQPDYGHYDYHPGHWDSHYDHYDYHPGHWDYHHGGHDHHDD